MKDTMVQEELIKNWEGHEMTVPQYEACEKASRWIWNWRFDPPEGMEGKYEKETGRSCVFWGLPKDSIPSREDLPRDPSFVSNGYSDNFVKWMTERIFRAVCEDGLAETCDIFRSILGK